MKIFSFFNVDTGLLSAIKLVCPHDSVAKNSSPPNHAHIEGDFDHLSQRVDIESIEQLEEQPSQELLPLVVRSNQKLRVVDYQPPSPGDDYDWIQDDEQGNRVRRWVKKPEVIEREAAETAARAIIAELERAQHRAVREALLGRSTETLLQIDTEISQQRAIIQANTKKAGVP